MGGITVIVVPTWAVWLFAGFAVVNIAQHVWKIVLLKKQARLKTPNADVTGKPLCGAAGAR